MTVEVLVAYLAACLLLAVTPGPNMALIIATTLARGRPAGLATIAGTTTGLAVTVTAAAVGMSSLMVFMAEWFDVVRWVGALYLAVLGAMQLRLFWLKRRAVREQQINESVLGRQAGSDSRSLAGSDACSGTAPVAHAPGSNEPLTTGRALSLYLQGLGVSLSNPKSLLFLGAFLPQFVDAARPLTSQLVTIVAVFVIVLATVDVACAIGIARARETIAPARLLLLDGVSGALLLAGGLALATLRRP